MLHKVLLTYYRSFLYDYCIKNKKKDGGLPDIDHKYKDRVIEALKELDLTDDQINSVYPSLLVYMDFLNADISDDSSLFSYKERIEHSAALMNIDKEKFLTAALEQLQLFYQSPETLDDNVTRSAAIMNIDKEKFLTAALKQPQLFYQSPETLDDNVTRSATLLNIDKEKFVTAALKQPQLFSQSPETISGHARLMDSFARKGLTPDDVQDFYLNQPITLSLADNNFHLRLAFAHYEKRNQQPEQATGFSLLTAKRKQVERNFVEALGFNPDIKTVTAHKPLPMDIENTRDQNLRILISNIQNGLLKGYSHEPAEAHDSPVVDNSPS